MPVTRERLAAYAFETRRNTPASPGRRKKFTGWVWTGFHCEPEAAKDPRFVVQTFKHSDARKLEIRVPEHDDYMSPGVVRDAIAACAELRGLPVAEVAAVLENPITFTNAIDCAVCKEHVEKSTVDTMPEVWGGWLQGVGNICRKPPCRVEAEATRAKLSSNAQPATTATGATAATPPVERLSGRAARDKAMLDEHNRAFGGT